MNDLIPLSSRAMERRTAHGLNQLQRRHVLDLAQVRMAESLEVAKLMAVDTVATVSMTCIAQQGVAEAWHASRAPHAAGRLALVADEFAIGAARRVRRLGGEL
jgi:hypothetical protein